MADHEGMRARRPRLPLPARLSAVAVGLLLIAVGAVSAMGAGGDVPGGLLGAPRHAVVCAIGAALVVLRAALHRRDRAVWIVLGAGAACYATALSLWTVAFGSGTDTPAQPIFITADLLLWAGLGLYLRRRVGDALPVFWLDTVGVALCLTTVLTFFWLDDVQRVSHLGPGSAIANLFYPAADAALASVPFVVASFSGRRLRGQDVLLGSSFLVALVADVFYNASLAGHAPAVEGILHLGWELQLVLLGWAAWARPSAARALRVGGWWEWLPTAAMLGLGCTALVGAHLVAVDPLVLVFGAATVAAGGIRSLVVLRDVRGLVVDRRHTMTDHLTGLPNRRALYGALDLLTRDGGHSGESAALLVIDLDGFRELNETLGHPAGDALLRTAADRMAPLVGADLLVRLGADEFAALVRPAAADPFAFALANAIRDALAAPIELDGVTVAIEGTIGIARFPADAVEASELARRAEVAVSDARRRRAGIATYAVERDDHSRDRLELAADLRRALAARDCGGLWAAFQPQIDLATGEVSGVETLVRWHHPVRGEVSPAELLPVAERSGQMSVLTDWILDRALKECARMAGEGRVLRVAVNVSAVTLVDVGLPERIALALRRHGVAPAQLVIEVTEDAVMTDQRRCLDVLEKITALGVGIAIDDFGTGQSSLAQLRYLPADELKIDRSFVKGMAEDALDAEVVRLVVAMGRSMALRVVAEGIETDEERVALAAIGCHVGQGYGLGRPMPSVQLERFLADNAVSDPQRRYAA